MYSVVYSVYSVYSVVYIVYSVYSVVLYVVFLFGEVGLTSMRLYAPLHIPLFYIHLYIPISLYHPPLSPLHAIHTLIPPIHRALGPRTVP